LLDRGETTARKESNVTENNLPQTQNAGFEGLKQTNAFGAEYWSARDLQPLLGYNHWRSFENAIKKAVTSCEQSGNDPGHHFARAGKMVGIGPEMP
jgi:DNA-damage-inducible protein D